MYRLEKMFAESGLVLLIVLSLVDLSFSHTLRTARRDDLGVVFGRAHAGLVDVRVIVVDRGSLGLCETCV